MSALCRRGYHKLCSIFCTKSRMRWFEDLCIDVVDFVVNKGMRALGPVLALAATCLISLCCFEYFVEIFPYLVSVKYADYPLMPYVVTVIGLYLLISIFFNHQSCVWTSPGYSPLTISLYPRRCQEIPSKYYKYDPELKQHDVVRYCNQCHCYKSWRAHHCSICKRFASLSLSHRLSMQLISKLISLWIFHWNLTGNPCTVTTPKAAL